MKIEYDEQGRAIISLNQEEQGWLRDALSRDPECSVPHRVNEEAEFLDELWAVL